MSYRFRDRFEAGQLLAGKLAGYEGRSDVVVLALPRGGVPVGFAVAERLRAALDIFLVRKLGAPGHEEYAMGAIASGGICYINEDAVERLRVPLDVIDQAIVREREEMERRERVYRKSDQPIPISNQTVILVDDGMATGASMRAAVLAVRLVHPAHIVIAVPVAPPETCHRLSREVDEMVCLETPEIFYAVGSFYDDFSQVGDEEVRMMLERATKFQQMIPA